MATITPSKRYGVRVTLKKHYFAFHKATDRREVSISRERYILCITIGHQIMRIDCPIQVRDLAPNAFSPTIDLPDAVLIATRLTHRIGLGHGPAFAEGDPIFRGHEVA